MTLPPLDDVEALPDPQEIRRVSRESGSDIPDLERLGWRRGYGAGEADGVKTSPPKEIKQVGLGLVPVGVWKFGSYPVLDIQGRVSGVREHHVCKLIAGSIPGRFEQGGKKGALVTIVAAPLQEGQFRTFFRAEVGNVSNLIVHIIEECCGIVA